MISVELHAGLRPAVARAHRRALLSLPMSFRVVDRGGDVLVAERGVAVDAVRIVRVGPREGLIAGEVADSPVWWDPVVARLAGALAPYADDLLAVAASAVVDGRARGEHVEPVAAELAEPGDLFTLTGTSVADYLDDDGEVDPGLVAEAVQQVLSTRPGLKARDRAWDPKQGSGNIGATPPADWSTLLRGH